QDLAQVPLRWPDDGRALLALDRRPVLPGARGPDPGAARGARPVAVGRASCPARDGGPTLKVVVLVDGEHYPPVTRWGIASARSMGPEVRAAVFVGGRETLADR